MSLKDDFQTFINNLEPTNIVLKAIAKGKPEYIDYEGEKAIKVADKIYTI